MNLTLIIIIALQIAIVIALLSVIKKMATVSVLRYKSEHTEFQNLVYKDLILKFKHKYTLFENAQVISDINCLSECNFYSYCIYSYFHNSICYICNKSAENYVVDWRKLPGKREADGKLWRKNWFILFFLILNFKIILAFNHRMI